ncbi:MAG TPA: DUF4249 family protein, partial [Mucilaginibacter sp.]|nr:DUF4249 family protein [Mucilaginibacter sp.]
MKYKMYIILFIIPALGCKKAYNPKVTGSSTNGYLVVEGVVNSGGDSTIISLSRTVGIARATTLNPESNAMVSVESDQNTSYPLKETTPGRYTAYLRLDHTLKYRLR